jgi:rhamnose utilization protein RhaD (predicted bifunctional aldolase and dehydrogenase)
LVDWVQGAGGNISFKNDSQLLIKASGFALSQTSATEGWVCCDLEKLIHLFTDSNEDFTGVVLEGKGKPSIETFLHCLDKKIVVHLHPMNFLPFLCASDTSYTDEYPIVPYIKPGLQLAKALFDVYDSAISVYWLANHGVVIAADTTEEIFASLINLQSKIPPSVSRSDPAFVRTLRRILPHDLLIRPILQVHPSTFHSRVFLPYTPDIVVFLQEAPLFFDELTPNPEKALAKYTATYGTHPTILYTPTMIYTIAPTLSKCVAIEEIFCAYMRIPPAGTRFLGNTEVDELVNWDKEKERKHAK